MEHQMIATHAINRELRRYGWREVQDIEMELVTRLAAVECSIAYIAGCIKSERQAYKGY
jgi:hypothetical protein